MSLTDGLKKIIPSMRENEEVFLVVREHWVPLLLKILVWCFFAVVLILFNRFAKNYLPNLFVGYTGQITLLFTQVYTLFLTASLFFIYTIYYLNTQVITSIRIVDVDQTGLFSHRISELHIDKIEDVTSETNGVLGTLFNYGNVYVQTAGTKEQFEFTSVPNPAEIEKMILDLYEKNSNFIKEEKSKN